MIFGMELQNHRPHILATLDTLYTHFPRFSIAKTVWGHFFCTCPLVEICAIGGPSLGSNFQFFMELHSAKKKKKILKDNVDIVLKIF